MHARAVTDGWMRRCLVVVLTTAGIAIAGCGGGGGDSGPPQAAAANPPAGSGGGSSAPGSPPKISGSPATQAKVGSNYAFEPVAQADSDDTLAFSVQNRPEWATFSTLTGMLAGTPKAEHTGQHGNIVITVSNGKGQAALPAFTITVAPADTTSAGTPPPSAGTPPPSGPVPPGAVTLQWTAPMQSTSGAALTNLAGYRIHYGKSQNALTHTIQLSGVGTSTFMVENLAPGTYYFAVRAFTSSGEQSPLSNVRSVVIS